jgi:membrane-bound lytic murein transglycosylase B
VAAELALPEWLGAPTPAGPSLPARHPAPRRRTRRTAADRVDPRALLAAGLIALTGLAVAAIPHGSGPREAGSLTPSLLTPPSGAPTAAAIREIPPRYLRLYRRFGAQWDIDWRFLAAIGGQESDHGRNPAAGAVSPAGCVGPMQVGVGGDCGDFVGAFGTDGDGDGKVDPRAPADAIATAARGLREGKGAPAPGGPYIDYYRAACAYYGACSDADSRYADEVMARAARYGLTP